MKLLNLKEVVLSSVVAFGLVSVSCQSNESRRINELCARGTFNFCEPGMTPAREPFYRGDGGKYCIPETLFSPEELRKYNEEQRQAFDNFERKHCLSYFSCSDK